MLVTTVDETVFDRFNRRQEMYQS
mgnify:CR=1